MHKERDRGFRREMRDAHRKEASQSASRRRLEPAQRLRRVDLLAISAMLDEEIVDTIDGYFENNCGSTKSSRIGEGAQ